MVKTWDVDWGWWGWALVIVGLLLAIGVTSGCSGFAPIQKYEDKAAEQAGRAVKKYCESLKLEQRQSVKGKVNAAAAPHSGDIDCEGDPPD